MIVGRNFEPVTQLNDKKTMARTLFVTGASGFVGQNLHAMLASPGASGGSNHWALVPASPELDIRNADALANAVSEARPDAVLHLAAQSFAPESFRDPPSTFAVNFGGTYNLLAGLRRAKFNGRLLYVSSGDIYGSVSEDVLPVTEDRLPAPRNPYAGSKVAAEVLCRQ